ncbi:O-antigen ligase [Methylophilus rhizosphaerae]|uniref:O-antigen ligase n=1 Tax=Methylophilus rhizosphaerae TaxID=492660 RepID=A0A1G9BJK9_9PROT|nr:O-antigen ligase family protein [Methylophilus rhizosphaerae]SDK39656.1 O-antigen ligase [Methylophilus rhizosphaerae]
MLNKIKPSLLFVHFYVIVLSVFFQALTLGEMYRTFAYINLALVFIGLGLYPQKTLSRKTSVFASVFLLIFIVWEGLVSSYFSFTDKSLRHLCLAMALVMGVVLLSAYHEKLKPKLMSTLIGLVYLYTLCQLIAVYFMGRPYGTTKNPHYLAIYSAIFLVVSIYLIVKNNAIIHRWLLGFSALVLGTLLLYTSSRPVWIALLVAIFLLAVSLRGRAAWSILIGTILLFAGLVITNAGNFKLRWEDLIMHANTEERVTIWQDAWQMQKSTSQPIQWVFGHGIESFERNFADYSRYHKNEHIDFNSPHNIVLELLYQFGIAGLILILSAIVLLYRKIISAYLKCRNDGEYAWVYLMMLLVLTIDFFGTSIILPFFVSININLLALIAGMTIYLSNIEKH